MRKMIFNLLIVAGLATVLSGCYPGGAEYLSDTDVVLTQYDPSYDFGAVKTFYLGDSIQHIVDEGNTPNYDYDQLIMDELVSQMEKRGYERFNIEDTAGGNEPDVVLLVTAAEVTNYNVYSYPYYPGWGWYWGWYKDSESSSYWYPDYGWYYPWYPYPGGPTYVTSYTTGTVLWRMVDIDNIDSTNKNIPVEWLGGVNGLLGNTTGLGDRIKNGIEQAFKQSPYIKRED